MTVREIVIEKLRALGADGLCNVQTECGCGGCDLDDVAPCDHFDFECEPARKVDCPGEGSCEEATVFGGPCACHYEPIEEEP